MKKIIKLVVVIIMVLSVASCHHHRTHRVVINDNNTYLSLNYSGNIIFNESQTSIESVSNYGRLNLKYKKDDNELIVKSTKNCDIIYRFYEDGDEHEFDNTGKALLKEAVQKLVACNCTH